ncbi:related to Rtm1p [Cephalotrichum gorgonifer]|uniref:Related to Rtm1p n=1 Tax=Cephalotrichum gorgonifer TaxID=2041049 RepID=A0AAE8N978_9PEZI|nr:related to Rtm1p [Cephalotrichum gorgonifer]
MATGNSTDFSAADAAAFDFKLYRYDLSLPAAATATTVFSILSLLHIWRLLRHRAFYFTAFTIGGFFQVIGYAARIWSHFDPLSVIAFSLQAIFILVAPALYAASIYMILGRLIRTLRSEHLSIVPVKWMTKLFVIGDVVSFVLQGGGGGIQAAGTLELYEIGEKVIIVGLFVQITIFSFFMVTAVAFHRRQTRKSQGAAAGVPWKRHLCVLYVVSVIILIRSIFRVVEYLQGNGGYLISHEIFLYMFDAVLMAAVMAIFLIYYVDDLDSPNGGKRESGMEMLSSSGTDTIA